MLSLKVRTPDKQLVTLKLKPETSLQTAISEVLKTQKLPHHSQDYFLYNGNTLRKWFDPNTSLEEITDILENELELVSRFLIVKVELLSTTTTTTVAASEVSSSTNLKTVDSGNSPTSNITSRGSVISTLSIAVDVDAPLRQTLSFAAKKFQIEDRDSFTLYAANIGISYSEKIERDYAYVESEK
jgi:hypothetical protein